MDNQIDDLDEILDSALDDFQILNLSSSNQRSGDAEEKKQESSALPSGVHGLGGMGLPDLKSKKKGKQKVPNDSHVSEAFNKLREQSRETVKGLESMAGAKLGGDDIDKDPMVEEMIKQIQGLAETRDMGSMESIVESMMQHLLSKDILHEPMKEIGERYPKWLEDNKSSLSNEEYERYSHQYELIKELNEVYEKNPGNYNKIVELMQKMQECGQPPNDIVQELSPDFDISNIGQLSPEMLESQSKL